MSFISSTLIFLFYNKIIRPRTEDGGESRSRQRERMKKKKKNRDVVISREKTVQNNKLVRFAYKFHLSYPLSEIHFNMQIYANG